MGDGATKGLERGQFVTVTYHRQTRRAMVSLASPDGRSIMVSFDGALHSPSGGAFFGWMPILLHDDGVYREIVEQAEVVIVPVARDPAPDH